MQSGGSRSVKDRGTFQSDRAPIGAPRCRSVRRQTRTSKLHDLQRQVGEGCSSMPTQVFPFQYGKFPSEFGTPSRARLGSTKDLSLSPGLENVRREISFRQRCPELQAHGWGGGVE